MKKPQVSVIIPVYNSEIYLPQCLNSLIRQTMTDYELILIDDGSLDKSGTICEAYASQHDNIRVIHQRNSGVSAARNAGLEIAQGQYFAFVDSDDWVEPNYLDYLVSTLLQNDCQLSSCAFQIEGLAHQPQSRNLSSQLVDKITAAKYVLGSNTFCGYLWNKLFCRNVIDQLQLRFAENIKIGEDMLFCATYTTGCNQVWIGYEVLYHYRSNQAGISKSRYQGNTFDPKWMDELNALEHIRLLFAEESVVLQACNRHYVRQAVLVLRAMVASNYPNKDLKNILISTVRHGFGDFLSSDFAGRGQKISVLLCTISPNLELKIWRYMQR